MAKRKNLKCPKCPRTFSMPAHLARHMNSVHSAGGARKKSTGWGGRSRRTTSTLGMRRGPGRPPKNARPWGSATRGRGRPSKMSLTGLGLEQLQDLMEAAREEARKRLHQLQSLFS